MYAVHVFQDQVDKCEVKTFSGTCQSQVVINVLASLPSSEEPETAELMRKQQSFSLIKHSTAT